MIRRIITIDRDRCNGCGACVDACHEGAIGMENGKAVLLRDDYCDGLGDCLPACPTDAISFEEREALPYDEGAVLANMRKQGKEPAAIGCTGARARELFAPVEKSGSPATGRTVASGASCLRQWPVQIQLVAVNASCFAGADLLIAADCTAFAYGAFHEDFMRGKVTLIGCPKLDAYEYAEKLTAIIRNNDIRSVTVARMSVPCCGGLERAVAHAVKASGKNIPLSVATITPEGAVLPTPGVSGPA